MSAPLVLSLFSGGGGGDVGLHRAGFATAAFCEIEPHARAVLRAHWPDVPLHGDVCELRGDAYRDVVLVAGGSPCQDLSVAGKRAGLDGARSGLFFEQIRVWEETGAPHILWENVVGALSSQQGRDFALVLGAIVGAPVPVPADGWGGAGVVAGPTGVAAWRVLDLQYLGPPQRRRRVFVLGARAGGVDPAEVLLEPESLHGDSQASRDAWQGVARRAAGGAGGASGFVNTGHGWWSESDVAAGIRTPEGGGSLEATLTVAFNWTVGTGDPCVGPQCPALGTTKTPAVLAFNAKQDGADADTFAPTLLAMPHDKSHANGGGQLAVVAFDTTQVTSATNRSNPRAGDPCHPLAAGAHAPLVVPAVGALSFDWQKGNDKTATRASTMNVLTEETNTLGTTRVPAVCVTGQRTHALTSEGEDGTGRGTPIVATQSGHAEWQVGDVAGPLRSRDAKGDGHAVVAGIPRRLTPRECERLMGWGDDHTRYGVREDGRRYELADGPRYRICGNGIGAPHTHWIGLRLAEALARIDQARAA